MPYVKLLKRLHDMLDSAMQILERSVVDFIQALHLQSSAVSGMAPEASMVVKPNKTYNN